MSGNFAGSSIAECGSRKTAFERNLLPGFAAWTLEQIERWQPDYLIPAETKGARALDAALSFAREELGERVSTPVLYGSALSYLPAEELQTARVMIVDDAVRTGTNLKRHWSHIAGHEVKEIKAIACIGYGEPHARRPDVDCYMRVDEDLYERYVWQLTELVVARGLPPEVDHFTIELRLPQRLARGWPELVESLAAHGIVTVDGPQRKQEEMQPVTLHFPQLPGSNVPPGERGDGVHKLRFFPDVNGERIFVLPISFPALTLADARPGKQLAIAQARAAIGVELGEVPPFGELLLDQIYDLDAKALFRIISACREVDMIEGLARLLGEWFPGSSLRPQAEVFGRLYGPVAGPPVGSRIETGLDEAITEAEGTGHVEASAVALASEFDGAPLYLDREVELATHGIAQELKRLYDQQSARLDHEPETRIGCSMPQLAAELPGANPLLASRCIDFGLALTTLVPYVEDIPEEGGSLRIERRYRVAETNRGRERSYLSLDGVRREKSEETLAVICHRLREGCEAFSDRPVPQALLASLVAILRPLTLAEQSISLKALPTADGDLELVLLDTVEMIAADAEVSSHFSIDDEGGVTPSEGFKARYEAEGLTLDLDGCTEEIESNVDKLVALIDGLEEHELRDLLDGWAMCTDHRLGLTHVRHSLSAALEVLRRPLSLIRTGEPHERTPDVSGRVRQAVDGAGRKLDLLSRDWSRPAREAFSGRHGRGEQRLLRSLCAAEDPTELYDFARGLGALITALAAVTERVDVASAEGSREGFAEPEREVAQSALSWAAEIRHVLNSLGDGKPAVAEAPADPGEAVAAAAAELLDLSDLLGAFNAAVAGIYCGPKGTRYTPGHANAARHAAILSLDLSGSTAQGELLDARTNKRWISEGLNLAAQWTRSLGGYEFSDRKGDELTIEFPAGDAAALAAAAVLRHTAVLRSTDADALSWSFHAGIECGEIGDDDGSNVIGACVNRAAKLAKQASGEPGGSEVPIGEEGARHCSAEVRAEPLSRFGEEVLFGDPESGGSRVRPLMLDCGAAMRRLSERARTLGERMLAELPPMTEIEPQLRSEAVGEMGGDATASDERDASDGPQREATGG